MAIKKIRELNLSIVEIEGDNLCLINVLNDIWLCPWKINLFISDIFSDLIGYVDFRFVHVFREVNQVADRIAKLGFSGPQRCWKNDLELEALIRKDALGWPYSRSTTVT